MQRLDSRSPKNQRSDAAWQQQYDRPQCGPNRRDRQLAPGSSKKPKGNGDYQKALAAAEGQDRPEGGAGGPIGDEGYGEEASDQCESAMCKHRLASGVGGYVRSPLKPAMVS